MVFSYPSTPGKMASTVVCFLTGASFFCYYGAYIRAARTMEMEENTQRYLYEDEEIEVGDILINLENLILQSAYFMNLTPLWAVKKRRSVLNDSSSSTTSSCIQKSPILITPKTTTVNSSAAVKTTGEVNAAAPSADSPLLFPPSSESDDKSNHCLRRHKDRRRVELLEEIQGLSERRELLRGEVEKVTAHYNKLLAQNTELKSLRQKVSSTRVTQLEKPKRHNFGPDLSGSNQIPIPIPQQQMLLIHPTAAAADYQAREPFQIIHNQVSQPLISSNNGNVASWVYSDCNIPVGIDPWSYVLAKRAKYAENRMNRKNKRAYAKTNMKFRLC